MAVWLLRPGRESRWESLALEHNVAVIGWEELPDLSSVTTRDAVMHLLQVTYPNSKPATLRNWGGQVWAFRGEIQPGDLVVVPSKTRGMIAVGQVTGDYQYRPEFPVGARHTRPAAWCKELPRSARDPDLLYSLGAFMTVCRIQRNRAEDRIRTLLAEGPAGSPTPGDLDEPLDEPLADLERTASGSSWPAALKATPWRR
jgi:restriction system protein